MVSGDLLTNADDGLNVPVMRQAAPWIVACAACAWLVVVLHNERRQTVELARIRSELSTSSLNASREIVHVQQELAEARKELAASRREMAASRTAARKAADRSNIDSNTMRNDPAYAGAWRRDQMRWIQVMKGDAIAALKLPPERQAKLRELLLDEVEADLDAGDAAKENGLSMRETVQARTQATADIDAQIKALIGPNAYEEFQHEAGAGAFKMVVNSSIAADLAIQGTPLTPDQMAPIAMIYADAHNPAYNSAAASPGAYVPDPATGLDAASEWIVDRASNFLTPAQVQTLKESLLVDQQVQQYYRQNIAPKKGP